MAVTFSQLPGELNVTFVQADEVAMVVDVDRDISGYQLEAPIYTTQVFAVGVGGASSGTAIGDIVTNWTVSVTDAAAGTIALGLTEAQTAALSPAIGYRWFLRWVDTSGYTRTVLSGDVTVRNP
jgi:hypothetical protein